MTRAEDTVFGAPRNAACDEQMEREMEAIRDAERRAGLSAVRTSANDDRRGTDRMPKTSSYWVQPWAWRWRGRHRWHRLAIGPLCLSIWPGGGGRRWFFGHSWKYRHPDGQIRHHQSVRRWIGAPRG